MQTLSAWRERARHLPVFEFYASILSGEGAREKLVGRLGPETPDMLDEFMRFALAQERAGLPSLQNFVSVLEAASPVIKREMDPAQKQVRIMTVHGAKGLEAPVVFLIDRGSPPHNSRETPAVSSRYPARGDPVFLWNGASGLKSTATETAKQEVARKAAGGIPPPALCRHDPRRRPADRRRLCRIARRRRRHLACRGRARAGARNRQTVAYPDFEALRFQITQASSFVTGEEKPENARAVSLPSWFRSPVPAEPPLPRPLAPSGASGVAIEREQDTAEASGAPSLLAPGDDEPPSLAVKRGIALHRLLQMLPSVQPDERRRKAAEYCHRFEHRWDAADIAAILGQAFAILEDPAHAALFGEATAAEVPVMGTLTFGAEERAVSGVIDRIAVEADRVLLVDYKTNAHPPRDAAQVPGVYLRQMALYRALVAPLYPGKSVEAFLLYTAGPRMIGLPDELLDAAYASLTPS
jgi:ATP-dependent helicase/nuclease subunit A